MLVLSRKKEERIVINDNIVITVVEIRDDRVRIGIEAPKDVQVHRHEIYNAIHGKDAVTGEPRMIGGIPTQMVEIDDTEWGSSIEKDRKNA